MVQAKPAARKPGQCRRELEVSACFAPLLAWILEGWPARRLALALDATTLFDRLVVLALSVVYRGTAIPGAWTVLPGNVPGAWKPHWLKLLRWFHDQIDPPWRVLVLTDRGLDASWLFRVLRRLGWPPGMRITRRNRFRPAGWVHDQPVWFFAARGGGRWQGRGVAFPTSKSPLRGTLGAWWAEGDEEGWYLVTALPPQAADAAWSGLRRGIEHGFAHFKSGGWPGQTTGMTAPDRVRRMWLALAVATLWVLSIGGPHDRAESPRETMPELATRGGASPPQGPHCPPQKQRLVSVLRQGMAWLWALLITGQSVLPGPWYPESWPEIAIIIQGRAHEE